MMTNQDIKMIIVDDEKPIRDLLKASIDWDSLGINIAGEADCTQEALELVESELPDIVITDICMPMTDGIELSRQIIEKYPNTKILIFTGHDEFDYATRSIKVGITDFLLKPLDEDEILKAIEKVKEDILTDRLQEDKYKKLGQYLEENRQYLEERCLNSLIAKNFDDEQIKQRLEYLGINFQEKFFQIAVIDVMSSMTSEDSEQTRLFLNLECQRLLKEYFTSAEEIYMFSDINYQNVLLLNNSSINFLECLEDIKFQIITRQKCYVSVGIGNHYDSMEQISLSYTQACLALKYRVVVGRNQIVNYKEIDISSEKQHIFYGDQKEDLTTYLKTGQLSKVIELIDTIFDKQNIGRTLDIIPARVAATNILSNVMNVLYETGLSDNEIFYEVIEVYERVFKFETIMDIQQSIKTLVIKTSQIIDEIKNRRENRIVEEIKAYLSQAYSDSTLSLTSVAKQFYLNSSYLSRCFKQETGVTFIEYLTKIRMEESMRLIRSTNARAYQIGEMVGIPDPKYFSQSFKKYAGMTVNEFKKEK